MYQEFELLETLKELRSLYRTGELREYDFDVKISQAQRAVDRLDDFINELEAVETQK